MLGPLGLGTPRGENRQAETVTEVRPRCLQTRGQVQQVRQQQREEGWREAGGEGGQTEAGGSGEETQQEGGRGQRRGDGKV